MAQLLGTRSSPMQKVPFRLLRYHVASPSHGIPDSFSCLRLSSDGDLNLNTSLDVDDDLLDDLDGGVQVDETLVDAHLEHVPGLGTLTVGGLTGADLEVLGGQTDRTLDAEVLALGAVDELSADLLEVLDVAAGEGDADLVDLGTLEVTLLWLVCTYR